MRVLDHKSNCENLKKKILNISTIDKVYLNSDCIDGLNGKGVSINNTSWIGLFQTFWFKRSFVNEKQNKTIEELNNFILDNFEIY